jgi:uncharacterized protein YndB with AHSA1/START domain
MTRASALAAFGVLALASAGAGAAERSDGYVVERSFETPASAEVAYDQFIDIASWWDPAHSYSGEERQMSLSVTPGGCWCETLPDTQGFVEHGRVLYAERGKAIRIAAALGPLQELGASGVMTVTFTQTQAGARVAMRYVVNGIRTAPTEKPVAQVLNEQMGRLAKVLSPE